MISKIPFQQEFPEEYQIIDSERQERENKRFLEDFDIQ